MTELKNRDERIKEAIKSCQIDFGHHHYSDMKRKQIRDCCNIDIDDLIQAIKDVQRVDEEEIAICIAKYFAEELDNTQIEEITEHFSIYDLAHSICEKINGR